MTTSPTRVEDAPFLTTCRKCTRRAMHGKKRSPNCRECKGYGVRPATPEEVEKHQAWERGFKWDDGTPLR